MGHTRYQRCPADVNGQRRRIPRLLGGHLSPLLLLLDTVEHVPDVALPGTAWRAHVPLRKQTAVWYRSQPVGGVVLIVNRVMVLVSADFFFLSVIADSLYLYH